MPAASTSSDAATADSRPTRRAIRGASGANAPKQSTGSVVSSPARAGERPVSARRSPSSGATATAAGRWLSATAAMAAANSTAAHPERAVPPGDVVERPPSRGPPAPFRAPPRACEGWKGRGPPPRRREGGGPSPSAGGGEHPGADGGVGGLVDQDEPAGDPVAGVVVDEQRLGDPQPHPADVVEAQLGGLLVAVQRVHVEPVGQLLDHRPHRAEIGRASC